ncbi:swi5-dependent recombination DNA repair protein 1 homolog isoform X3 [Rhipicephalus sanguineus]|uniref:swi5-dependent recombination DNA repair protein 1 homolog isoform X3 n=1 Tax=Rhipicephalus sanguineus TaxID=34632 RepID=UPI0020C38FEB|nr:swi5-dependent recombination DNA repair protein 1 homolog isoform X3 [Rhipicephalus sanguineus]
MESPTPEENAPRCKDQLVQQIEGDQALLQKAIANAQREVSRKEDILRQLNIVKTHRKKNQKEPITELIEQWRSAAQQAILDFQQHMAEPRPGLKDILSNFQIEPSVIGYSEDDDCFV